MKQDVGCLELGVWYLNFLLTVSKQMNDFTHSEWMSVSTVSHLLITNNHSCVM